MPGSPLLQCLPVPKGMTLIEAAALPENYFTVLSNLIERGRLGTTAEGTPESLLVLGGSSGIGVTAIQLARVFGHRVFATTGNPEKCAACEQLGAHAINYCVSARKFGSDAVLLTLGVIARRSDGLGGDRSFRGRTFGV